MKKSQDREQHKRKIVFGYNWGDWVWSNDINIYAEMFQCVIRTARRNFRLLIRNIFSFFGYLFLLKKVT